MKKFFLFRQEAVGATSVRTSDTGLGLSVFVIPADKLSFMTATEAEVQMVFDDATLYQESALYTGEAIEKTSVGVACKKGDELRLIDDVMKFMSSEKSVSRFMRFDGASGGFTSDYVDTTKSNNVSPKIKANPINVQTGDRSFGDATAVTANTIAGINFNYTQPFLDYNHEGLSSTTDASQINSWANAGSGGSTYNISTNVGDPECVDPSVRDLGLAHKGALLVEGEHFIVPSAAIKDDYTLYFVTSTKYASDLYSPYFMTLYGDAAGETLGPGGEFKEDGEATKIALSKRHFSFRHSGKTGAPARLISDSQIVQSNSEVDFDPCHVFVIRRTSDHTMFVHDRTGKVIAQIEDTEFSANTSLHKESHAPECTEGPLLIERLGTTADILTNHYSKQVLGRFGVIPSDIGYNESVRLADDLYKLYSN
jgi:hypothetical protein